MVHYVSMAWWNEGEPGEGLSGWNILTALSRQNVEPIIWIRLSGAARSFRSIDTADPFDLVCGVRIVISHLIYLLTQYGFISHKTYAGRHLKPPIAGLWNGAMAYWNTVFVEMPLSTFSPVKTVLGYCAPSINPEPFLHRDNGGFNTSHFPLCCALVLLAPYRDAFPLLVLLGTASDIGRKCTIVFRPVSCSTCSQVNSTLHTARAAKASLA
jgi:hypothetical protein